MGQDRAGSTVTCQGLDGPRVESRSGRGFRQPSRLALVFTQPPAQIVPASLSREEKRP